MNEDNKKLGCEAEYFIMGMLRARKINCCYADSWYDISAGNQTIEVKSAHLTVKNGLVNGKQAYTIGRFDFTNPENRELQKKNNSWIAFILHHNNQIIVQGFIRARDLPEKRYVSIHELQQLKLWNTKDWLLRMKSLTRIKVIQ